MFKARTMILFIIASGQGWDRRTTELSYGGWGYNFVVLFIFVYFIPILHSI